MSETTESPRAFGPIYQDANYKYFGDAFPGTALTENDWSVSRMDLTTSQITWVDGGNSSSPFTDLATVALLTYS